MKNTNFKTVKVAGKLEKFMQTVVCGIEAIVVTISAIGVANSIHELNYVTAALWAVLMMVALGVFIREVIAWGESSNQEEKKV